ncbi:hypothetical protein HG547_18195 [Shewanella sp. DNRA4]|uniref:hypothetical protein n=1 Tax=Shewanella sp. DNRA4 TaxID=2723055 RepID=UPI00146F52A7|nr:hypothetical protein [Shewanella sp. DNRA4]NMD53532.1 hypothetical protein [Shewanella sp. DNRA4]
MNISNSVLYNDQELSLDDFREFLEEINKAFNHLIEECNSGFNVDDFLFRFITEHDWIVYLKNSIKFGWYWVSDEYVNYDIRECIERYNDGKDSYDSFMSEKIEASIHDIKSAILSSNSSRAHIINEAFSLFDDGRYFSCIPLFLSQSDGIVKETFNKSLFDKAKERSKFIKRKMDNAKSMISDVSKSDVAVETLFLLTQMDGDLYSYFIEHTDKAIGKKGFAPNRHAILHGDVNYLDYGTKLNSLKCIALLSYVSELKIYFTAN